MQVNGGDLIEWTVTPVLPDREAKLLLLLLLLLFPLSLRQKMNSQYKSLSFYLFIIASPISAKVWGALEVHTPTITPSTLMDLPEAIQNWNFQLFSNRRRN